MAELGQIAIILVASLLAGVISKRIGIPVVVGQLLVGILLAPACFGVIKASHTLEFLSEIGVILLMFLAGLESDLDLLKKYFRPSLFVAIFGVVIPLLSFGAVAQLLGYSLPVSVFYGIVFAATSVSITVEVLQEYGKLQTRSGTIILGAAVVDDILAVLILSFFMSSQSGSGNLVGQIGLQAIFLLFLVGVYKVIPWVFDQVERLPIYAKYTTVSLVICFALSLLADRVGMSAVIGSFFAGVAIGQTEMAHKIENYTSSLAYVFFIPIFFISIALPIQFEGVIKAPMIVIVLTALAVLTKLIPSYAVSRIERLTHDEGMLIGSGMVSRGEMALIVAQIGMASSLISSEVYSELVIVIILSTLIAPLMIKYTISKAKGQTLS